MKLRAYARAAALACEMSLRQVARDSFVIFTVLLQPLVIALLGLWMLRGNSGDYGIYVVVGSGLTGLWSGILFLGGNSITFERWTGTLETIAGVPTPLHVIVLGKTAAAALLSFSGMVAGYLLGSLLFGYPLQVAQPGPFAVSVALALLAFASTGMLLAPLFLLNPSVQSMQNGLEFPVYVLCGFLFPAALLPGWLTPISYALAPYWAARALHGTSSGGMPWPALAGAWAALLALVALYGLISAWLFRRVLRKVREDATLGLE